MDFPPPTNKQAHLIWIALYGLAIAAIIALVVALVWGIGQLLGLLSPVLWPLAVAGIIACLLSPVVDWLERRRKLPRARAIVLVFFVAIGLLGGIMASVIPQMVVETRHLISKIPEYADNIQKQTEAWLENPPDVLRHWLPGRNRQSQLYTPGDTNSIGISNVATNGTGIATQPNVNSGNSFDTDWLAKILPSPDSVTTWIGNQIGKLTSWIGILVGLALIPVYAFYFLLEKRGIKSHWKDYLPIRDSVLKDELIFVLDAINEYLVAFFRGQVLVAIVDSILYTICFFALGLNYAFVLGFMALLLTMIPFVGPTILAFMALTLTFAQFGDWQHPLAVFGVVAVIQTLESAVISPKIMGDRVNLHPLVIIVAVVAGTELMGGLLGGILAIPLAAALRVILFRYVWKKRSA